MKYPLLVLGLLSLPATVVAMGEDDPLLFMLKIDQLELREAGEHTPLTWDAHAWLGKDLNKLFLKTEGARINDNEAALETQLLYSRAIAPYWDIQTGWRHEDAYAKPNRDWLAVGLHGLAPYFFETDLSVFADTQGRTALHFRAEYELLFTQRWILSPAVEITLHGKDDPEAGIGSGLSEIAAGLRLRYEIRREFAPYIGVQWGRQFGKTAEYARAEGMSEPDTQFVIGIRAWF